jgi:hypothetical protein
MRPSTLHNFWYLKVNFPYVTPIVLLLNMNIISYELPTIQMGVETNRAFFFPAGNGNRHHNAVWNNSSTTCVTYRVGTAYSSRAPAFTPVFSVVRGARIYVFVYCFVDRYLSFCPFSFDHCIACPSASDYLFGIFKLLFKLS